MLAWNPSEQNEVVRRPFAEYPLITFWTSTGNVKHKTSKVTCNLFISMFWTSLSRAVGITSPIFFFNK